MRPKSLPGARAVALQRLIMNLGFHLAQGLLKHLEDLIVGLTSLLRVPIQEILCQIMQF